MRRMGDDLQGSGNGTGLDVGSGAYVEINKAWKATCRIVLGGEIGDIGEYGEWLSEHMEPYTIKKSTKTGKPVFFGLACYCENGSFRSFDEPDLETEGTMISTPRQSSTAHRIDINKIKDIDSIIEAFGEQFAYSGNVVLGNSRMVARSSNIQNSAYILNSNFITDSEYLAYSSHAKKCRMCFGTKSDMDSSYVIRDFEAGYRDTRCFEMWMSFLSSDCYFSFGLQNCQETMFSFNLDNASYTIGNTRLAKDRYFELKKKLLAEIREELQAHKKLPSLMDIISSEPDAEVVGRLRDELLDGSVDEPDDGHKDMGAIEKAFSQTTRIVLGRELNGITQYENWLMQYQPGVEKAKSILSDKQMFFSLSTPHHAVPRKRTTTRTEARALGKRLRLNESEMQEFGTIKKNVGMIGFTFCEGRLGNNRNIINSPLVNQSLNCYNGSIFSYNENCACCYWSRESKDMFGCAQAHNSSFCINSYHSTKLARAFEADSCNDCSGTWFTHNCENVHDSMFCFNVKNLRNAIGNTQLEPAQYKAIASSIREQVCDELEAKKGLEYGIFNIGCLGTRR